MKILPTILKEVKVVPDMNFLPGNVQALDKDYTNWDEYIVYAPYGDVVISHITRDPEYVTVSFPVVIEGITVDEIRSRYQHIISHGKSEFILAVTSEVNDALSTYVVNTPVYEYIGGFVDSTNSRIDFISVGQGKVSNTVKLSVFVYLNKNYIREFINDINSRAK